jgi:hypothetical protein
MRSGKWFGLSAFEKSDIWNRWKAGQSLHEIGRAFDKPHTSNRLSRQRLLDKWSTGTALIRLSEQRRLLQSPWLSHLRQFFQSSRNRTTVAGLCPW